MSLIKDFVLETERDEQDLWLSYLDWVADNKEVWDALPKNIKDELEDRYED